MYTHEKIDNARIISDAFPDSQGFFQCQDSLLRFWGDFYDQEPSFEDKDILIKTLFEYFRHNESMQPILNEFKETIGSDTAINWYTREPLIYRLINNAFRTCDWDFLEKFRYFMNCIRTQLTVEHNSFVEKDHENPFIIAYHGHLMHKMEFDRLIQANRRILFVTGIISTSLQEHVAMNYLHNSEPSYNELRVLFKIVINKLVRGTQPYADISHLSANPHEQELMIMSGATFVVTDVLLHTQRKVPVILLELSPYQVPIDINAANKEFSHLIPDSLEKFGKLEQR